MELPDHCHRIRIVKDPAIGDVVLVRLDGRVAPAIVTEVHSAQCVTVVALRDQSSSATRVITSANLDMDLQTERTWCPREAA